MKDIIIVGAGPAGLSAALYTCRAGLSTMLIYRDGGALAKASEIGNYFGTGTVSGSEMLATGRKQAAELGAEFAEEEVLSVSWDGNFTVTTGGGEYHAKAVLLTTGSGFKSVRIPGLKELEGRGVSYCAVCDAFLYRGKKVGVLGSGEYALHELNELLPLVGEVVLLSNGKPLAAEFPENIKIADEPIKEIVGEDVVEHVRFADGTAMSLSGVFVALGSAGATDLARKLGVPVEGDKIVTNPDGSTLLPGLFAAGDCVSAVKQVSVAVGQGALAGLAVIEYVRKAKKA